MNTPPIIAIVGRSGSGKTTFMEKLIPELKARGWRVGVIKHHGHTSPLDQPGKDTWRHAEAGADRVAIASSVELALFERLSRCPAPTEIVARFFTDMDIILAEGYRQSELPKIEICRAARSSELLCEPDELLAIMSDLRFPISVPQFDLEDVAGVADLIEARFLNSGSA
ncbi:MAG TPA: molybdopterin-guanine dinucleotide biosynthesis protein B [Caldilineae bacterium]|nr:molybdopterin-guanine dinucleotide biosynthesis protein B [Caldilineae bacterium]